MSGLLLCHIVCLTSFSVRYVLGVTLFGSCSPTVHWMDRGLVLNFVFSDTKRRDCDPRKSTLKEVWCLLRNQKTRVPGSCGHWYQHYLKPPGVPCSVERSRTGLWEGEMAFNYCFSISLQTLKWFINTADHKHLYKHRLSKWDLGEFLLVTSHCKCTAVIFPLLFCGL